MKKLIGVIGGLALLTVTAIPAFAASGCTLSLTGPSSTQSCSLSLSKLKSLSLSNSASVTKNLTTNSTSGNNVSSNNTTGGMTNNGAADASNGIVHTANSANVTVTQGDPAVDYIGTIDSTGPSSSNTVSIANSKSATLSVSNSASVNYTLNATANSGNNTSSNNTAGGSVKAGDAASSNTVVTDLNGLVIMVTQ